MSKGSKNSLRFVCPNESCINKSIVYRRFDVFSDYTCKACNHQLKLLVKKLTLKQDAFAKEQLKELNA